MFLQSSKKGKEYGYEFTCPIKTTNSPVPTYNSFECFVADRTGVRTFGHVRRPMSVQVFLAFQSRSAIIANEWPFRSMNRQVGFDRLAVIEDRVALRASVERAAVQGRRKSWLQTGAPSPWCRQTGQRIAPLFLLFGLLGNLKSHKRQLTMLN